MGCVMLRNYTPPHSITHLFSGHTHIPIQ
jgi:hypothetical protein